MMRPSSVAFRAKLVYPCRKALHLLVFKCKLITKRRGKPRLLAIRPPSLRSCSVGSRRIASALISAFSWGSKKKEKKMVDRSLTDQLESMTPAASDTGRDRPVQLHFPSQLLPSPSSHRSRAIAKASPAAGGRENFHEDACRRFENYLVEMIVEEGKVRDLMDVEELLHCWKNLKCPVFIDLVSRFYGDLCEDLFSATASDDGKAAATP